MSEHNRQTTRKIKFFLLIFFASVVSLTSSCSSGKVYVIRSAQEKGLVLDATDPTQIKIQHFTGFRTQLWKLESGSRPGLFYIASNYTGKVLDFNDNEEKELILSEKEDVGSQQWDLTLKGCISNVGKEGHNVDIANGNFTPGNIVQIFKNHGGANQEFVLVEKV